MDKEFARQQMIEQQVRTWDVLDQQVLEVMGAIPREQFFPETWRECAFVDMELPIGDGQFSFSPKLEGRFLQALRLTGSETCIEVGTGCGYFTACLAQLTKRVISLEQSEMLAEIAKANLRKAAVNNVEIIHAAAPEALPEQRFDVVVAGGSVTHHVKSLERMLNVGGRAIVVLDRDGVMSAHRITRISQDHLLRDSLFETRLAPLSGFAPTKSFEF